MRPTNIELVEDADAIVIAKSQRLLRSSAGDRIKFVVDDVIKGDITTGEELVFRGTHAAHTEPTGEVDDFSLPRRGAFAGGCIAYDYSLWGRYLLILKKSERGWGLAGYPFTRVNEQVSGARDDWEVAVRHYHAASLLELGARDAMLHKLAAMAESNIDPERYPAAMAHDITTHFATPTMLKPATTLVAMYEQRSDDATRLRILWAIARGKDPAARDFMRAKLGGKLGTLEFEAIAVYFTSIEDREAIDAIFAITRSVVARGFSQPAYWRALFALMAHAKASDEERMREIYAGVSDEAAGHLESWFLSIEGVRPGARERAREARQAHQRSSKREREVTP